MASAAPAETGKDFQHFLDIIESFRTAGGSASDAQPRHIQVAPFLDAMTMFLRIFDAFSNPFFSDVVKKDVVGNIKKLREAAQNTGGTTLEEVIDKEISDPKLLKLIKKESGIGQSAGTVALLWLKRMMQFVGGLLQLLVLDPAINLSSASRKSYSKSLSYCHNFVTRGIFDTGLRFAPTREVFYANLAGGAPLEEVTKGMQEYLSVFKPLLDGIVALYLEKGLEPYIKA